jgi:outer membrane immunogenic protein
MQKSLMAASLAAVLGMGGAALAADVYSSGGSLKDGPVAISDWSGLYVGVGIGGGGTFDDLKGSITHKYYYEDPSAELNSLGGQGILGTVGIGYDRQYGKFVGGVFFDYDFADISGKASLNLGYASYSATFKLTDSWTVGGRLGYLLSDNVLAYALGGYTEAKFDIPSGLKNDTRDGYTVGGGLETRLSGNWYLKGEYRFTRLGEETLLNTTIHCWNVKLTDQTDIQTARAVLSYKADIFGRDYTPLK